MKNSSKIYVSLIAMTVAMGACSDNNEIENSVQIFGDQTPYQNVETLPNWYQQGMEQMSKFESLSSVNWKVDDTPGVFDDRSSMVIFTSTPWYFHLDTFSSSEFNSKEDRLAAFVNDECRGVATCEIAKDNTPHFNLVVRRKESDPSDMKFVLKLFTVGSGGVMVSEEYDYQSNGCLGSYANPLNVKWTNRTDNGYYYFKISFRLKLPWTPSNKDCFILEDQNGSILVFGGNIQHDDNYVLGENDYFKLGKTMEHIVLTTTQYPVVTLKYYRAEEKRIYTVNTSVNVEDEPNIGVIEIKI